MHTTAEATAEEEQATLRLKQAEGKITSLMQELDELKFFSEIEAASPAKTNDSMQVSIHNPQQHTTPTAERVVVVEPVTRKTHYDIITTTIGRNGSYFSRIGSTTIATTSGYIGTRKGFSGSYH